MLPTLSPLQQTILEILSRKPHLTVRHLLELLSSIGNDYSQRGVYKSLQYLEDQEIVFKLQGRYALRLSWIINLLADADSLYERYTHPDQLARILKSSSGKETHRFTELRRLDLYWMQLMIALHKHYPKVPMYLWCPYQWFHLIHPSHGALKFYQAIYLEGGKRYQIIGNDSPIDREGAELLPKGAEYSFAEGPFHDEREKYYTVIGDHIITTKLDKQTTEAIHDSLNKVKTLSDLTESGLLRVLHGPVKASITVEEHSAKSMRLRRKFCDYFGITIT